MKKIAIDALIALGFFALMLQAFTEMEAERLFRMGDDFRDSGELELAVVAYRDALEITPDRFEILRALGEASIQSYDPTTSNLRPLFMAESVLREAAELNPIYPYSWHELGVVTFRLQQAGAPDAAKPDKFFRRALEIDPQNPRFLAWLMLWQLDSGLKVEGWNTFMLLIDSDPVAIFVYGDQLIHDDADVSRLLREIKGEVAKTVQLANLLYRRMEFLRAVELIRSLPADHQTQPEAATALASSLRQLGRFPEAEKALRDALAQNPKNLYLVCDLGRTLALAKKNRESIELFSRAVTANPDELWLCLEAANVARQTKEWDPAAQWYESVLSTHRLDDSQTRDALIGLGDVRRQQGKLRPALIVYEQLLELDPDNRQFKETIDSLQQEIERQAQSNE